MVHRKRLDIFFVFYLTALAGFIVVSLEKNKFSARNVEEQEHLLTTLLTSPAVSFDRDTVFWYVAASELGDIREDYIPFRTQLYVTGFDVEDSMHVKPYALHFGSSFISPSVVNIGNRQIYGDFSDNRVIFPVAAALRRVGTYTLDFDVHTTFLHRLSASQFRYRETVISSDLLKGISLERLQTHRKRLTIVVEDTSGKRTKFIRSLSLDSDRKTISSAIGFEDTNRLSTNLDYLEPTMRIVRGTGRIEKRASGSNASSYVWIGTVKFRTDTVHVEARVRRNGGGSDIAHTFFVLNGENSFLYASVPEICYAGEELRGDLRVSGLSNPGLYSYSLSVLRSDGEQAVSPVLQGPIINHQINAVNAEKVLRIRAYYNGKPYPYLSMSTATGGVSVFDIPIKTPPYHIEFNPPDRAGTSYAYQFRIFRYHNPRFKELIAISDPRTVQFEMHRITGEHIRIIADALRSGYLRYRISSPEQIKPKGEEVSISIKTPQTSITKNLFIYRDSH